jgi:hypothetical protein
MEAFATLEAGSPRPIAYDDFARNFSAIRIEEDVPHEVRRAFLFARNAMCYGYWCYGLMTLGTQQMMRVADDGIALAARERGLPKRLTFVDRLRNLIALGVVPAEDEFRWDVLRRLRNNATHQEFQQILTPPDAARMTATVAHLLARVAWRRPTDELPTDAERADE